MPKPYEVIERSFINGRLYEAGEIVVLELDSPGSNLKPVKGKASLPEQSTVKTNTDGNDYAAKHNGGGRFIVVDKGGERVGEFTGTKDEAETEAARLNAGGEITVKTNTDGNDGDSNGPPDA